MKKSFLENEKEANQRLHPTPLNAAWVSLHVRRRKMTMRRALVLSLGIAVCVSGFVGLAQNLPTLTVGGVTYTNVNFGTVTPTSVSIIHSTGIATLLLSALPTNLQAEFNYDPERVERAAEAAARQQENAKNAYFFSGTTIQVLDDGAIFRGKLMTYADKQEAEKKKRLANELHQKAIRATTEESIRIMKQEIQVLGSIPLPDKGNFFVAGIQHRMADDESWSGIVYYAGLYKYVNTYGAPTTIRAYATSPELAKKIFK